MIDLTIECDILPLACAVFLYGCGFVLLIFDIRLSAGIALLVGLGSLHLAPCGVDLFLEPVGVDFENNIGVELVFIPPAH